MASLILSWIGWCSCWQIHDAAVIESSLTAVLLYIYCSCQQLMDSLLLSNLILHRFLISWISCWTSYSWFILHQIGDLRLELLLFFFSYWDRTKLLFRWISLLLLFAFGLTTIWSVLMSTASICFVLQSDGVTVD